MEIAVIQILRGSHCLAEVCEIVCPPVFWKRCDVDHLLEPWLCFLTTILDSNGTDFRASSQALHQGRVGLVLEAGSRIKSWLRKY